MPSLQQEVHNTAGRFRAKAFCGAYELYWKLAQISAMSAFSTFGHLGPQNSTLREPRRPQESTCEASAFLNKGAGLPDTCPQGPEQCKAALSVLCPLALQEPVPNKKNYKNPSQTKKKMPAISFNVSTCHSAPFKTMGPTSGKGGGVEKTLRPQYCIRALSYSFFGTTEFRVLSTKE